MIYKILIISLLIFFINEYFFKDRLLTLIGVAHKYIKTFILILAMVAIFFSIKKETSIIGKLSTLSRINLNNPLKHISEILQETYLPNLNKESYKNKDLDKNKYEFTLNTKNSKRSVSETKKKVVAHNQDWKCEKCKMKLPPSFEVHHIKPLYNGGSNEIDNLVALCRNCHGSETVNELIKN